jgi:uncharacterized protein
MSESPSVINVLEALLPPVEDLELEPMADLRSLYAGVGMPSLRATEVEPLGFMPFGEMFRQISDRASLRRVVEIDEFLQRYRLLRAEALEGDYEGMNDLGWLWLNGRMLPTDHSLARRLFRLAAASGCSEALFNLAEQHYYGKGVPVDLNLAADYYQQAYSQGIIPAARMLGSLYLELSEHESVNPQLIAEWFRKGAEDGDLDAGYELGCYLLRDDLPTHDEPTALYWLQHVSLRGDCLAAERLAEYFQTHMSYGESSTRLGDFWLQEAVRTD